MSERSMWVVTSANAHARQRLAALNCLAVVLVFLLVFRETALSMADIWRRSETFSHGFLVVPVSLWLVWRKRDQLARLPFRPYWPGLLMVGIAGFIWLAGSLADANVVMQFALVLMIQSAVVTILGLTISRALTFPILFLYFAVPFGEAFVPKLMDWTADFTVLALKLSGVPVYREGNNFVIPSGRWSVVEACSGIRYLIASLMAGTLFGYLMYKSAWRRALFVGAAIVVPILANWLRAYLIVMIGHLSVNELAAGVDHLIYGWVFFGIVLFLMFWVGARYREDADAPANAESMIAGPEAVQGRPGWAALATVALAVGWLPLASALTTGDPGRQQVQLRIEGANGWQPVDEKVGPWRPHFSGHRSEIRQIFERGGDRVVLNIFYYFAQNQGTELINSENVLVTTKDSNWRIVARGQTEHVASDRRRPVRTATLAGAQGRIDVAWWYWVDGRTTISDAVAKGLLAWSRLRLRGDDSAAVFLTTEAASERGGEDPLRRFAADMSGEIERALAAAGEGGL
jgi:exosortase A